MNKFKLKTEFGTERVRLTVAQYETGGLYVGLESKEQGEWESYCDLTKNFPDGAPDYCGYVSTDHTFDVEEFIKANDLGVYQGLTIYRGYTQYHLYMFNADKLRELCPKEMEEYERSIGKSELQIKN